MTTQHTPGPWTATGDLVQTADHEIDIAVMIALDVGTGKGTIYSRREANARLIAAAPELLEALKRCETELRSLWKTQGVGAIFETAEQARAAIAKAEGGA